MTEPGFEVPSEYRFLYAWDIGGPSEEALREALPIERIELERTQCFGPCPAYLLTLSRNGIASYEGRAFTAREGLYEGEIDLATFAMLGLSAERIGFANLKPEYSIDVTDQATAIVRVVWTNGSRKEVSSYAYQAPPEFWLLTEVLDAVADDIEWTPSVRR